MHPEELRLRDEVLQVLFWLRGEGLGDETSLRELAIWLGVGEEALPGLLGGMAQDGLLEPGKAPGSYRLTAVGLAEGERRFVDAFRDHGLGWGGPGSCGPDCEDCLVHGPDHCHVHRERS